MRVNPSVSQTVKLRGRDGFFIYKIKLVRDCIHPGAISSTADAQQQFLPQSTQFSMTLVQNQSWLPALGHTASSVVTLKPAPFVCIIWGAAGVGQQQGMG